MCVLDCAFFAVQALSSSLSITTIITAHVRRQAVILVPPKANRNRPLLRQDSLDHALTPYTPVRRAATPGIESAQERDHLP